jgi:hypothetical protein
MPAVMPVSVTFYRQLYWRWRAFGRPPILDSMREVPVPVLELVGLYLKRFIYSWPRLQKKHRAYYEYARREPGATKPTRMQPDRIDNALPIKETAHAS